MLITPDVLIGQSGQQTTLTALTASPTAYQVVLTMSEGTYIDGTRYLDETDAYLAFDLLDAHNLTTLVLA